MRIILLLWFFCVVYFGKYLCSPPQVSLNKWKIKTTYNKFVIPNRHLIRIVYFAPCTFKNTRTTTKNNKNYPKYLPLASNYEHGWSSDSVCWDHSSGAYRLNHQFQMTIWGLICLGQDFLLQPKWSKLPSLSGSLSLSWSDKWPRGSAFSNGHVPPENN